MSRPTVTALALVLLLAPIFAALPDDTTLPQTVWASLLSALVMCGVLSTVAQSRQNQTEGTRPSHAVFSFAVLVAIAALSAIARLATHRGIAYLDLMLRGWAVLAVEFALFVLCRRLAHTGRTALYTVAGAAVIGSAVIASVGVNEYLLHYVARQTTWRVFATSTPDFLAGYLVLLLPVTLALFLGAPAGKRLPLLFGLVIVLQMATLLTTGSRFALVSLIIAFAVFAGALTYAVRSGLTLDAALRRRIVGIVAVVFLAALAAAGPILHRLNSGASQENSGAFRLWTWRGAARMAAANPLLGTGVGTWIDTYPRYALTGFTRLAHNSYLQMADECGVPAVLALIATLAFVGVAGVQGLKRPLSSGPLAAELPVSLPRSAKRRKDQDAAPVTEAPPDDLLTAVAPADDRLLLCGLLGSLAAGVVQNLIDSDWHVFFIGTAFWAFAGLAVGVAEKTAPDNGKIGRAVPSVSGLGGSNGTLAPPLWGAGGAALLLLFISQGVAAWYGYQAQIAADPGAARDAYETAHLWNPLSARYPAELGARVEARAGNLSAAETALRQATRLEPSGTNFRRLGTILDAAGRKNEAAAAYGDGLRVDPNSLELLLALAKDSTAPHALTLYQRIATLEDSPVGRVRAIGEITEVRFALADAALGDAARAAGKTKDAARHYGRAQRLLEAYLDEGGTENGERQVQTGNHPDPTADAQFRDLYTRVMNGRAELSAADQQAAILDRAHDNGLRFQAVADAAQADTATTAEEARSGYQRAATGIEHYVAKAQTPGAGDPKAGAQMSGLYKHVLDRLSALTPGDQQAAVQAREQAGLRKFAEAFPAL